MAEDMMEHDMRIISQLSENQKLAFMKAFARLAAADGNVDADEKEFIKDAALSYGIPKSRVEEIWRTDTDEELLKEVREINNRKAALVLIKEMCLLAHADDDLSDEETLFIGRVGEAMGIELDKIREISNWVIERIIWLEKAKLIFEEV